MTKTVENDNFRMGVRDGLPIGLGYLSVSFAFGIFAVASGLGVWETVLISMLNLTSAGQLAGVPIIAGRGSFFELGLTQLVINLRYSLMSVSLSQRLGESVRVRDRFLISFANTDEVFAVAFGRGEMLGRRYFFGLIISPYIGQRSSFNNNVGARHSDIRDVCCDSRSRNENKLQNGTRGIFSNRSILPLLLCPRVK